MPSEKVGQQEQALPELLSQVKADSSFLTRSDQDTALPRWGMRSEEPALLRASPAKGHSHISRTRGDVVCVVFGPSYKAQKRILLEQVTDHEDIQYFSVNFTEGILRLCMPVSLAFVLIFRQLLGREEEKTLKLTYILSYLSQGLSNSLPSNHSIVAD